MMYELSHVAVNSHVLSKIVLFKGLGYLVLIGLITWVLWKLFSTLSKNWSLDNKHKQIKVQQTLAESAFFVGRYKQMASEWGFDFAESLCWMEKRLDLEDVNPSQRLRLLALEGGDKPSKTDVLPGLGIDHLTPSKKR